ncbi:CCA tRNA nucleotidyltransferase [Candidatus Poriferisodalis sp.]|uniref:CCA tRNA nucleotidyltransferase n=1 Tax=Candidatus Poriferisodalis sp. TaxID=3101277 RepID=UPI003B02050D
MGSNPTRSESAGSSPTSSTPVRAARPAATFSDAYQPELNERIGMLAEAFADAGHRFFLVGGLVRDALLGRGLTGDIDITTDAFPDRIAQLLADWADTIWDQGKNFGTVGARRGSTTVEITTHRAESYDRESRKPNVRFSSDITTDLGRRDFTVNAMAVEMPGWAVLDPFGGMQDLANGVLRTPSEPEGLFSDDPLRMLRAARFCSQLDLSAGPELIAAVRSVRPRLAIVSRERIATELTKLLELPSVAAGADFLAVTGLLGDLVHPWRASDAEVPAAALDSVDGDGDRVPLRWAILLGPVCGNDAEAARCLSALRIKGATIKATRSILRAAHAVEVASADAPTPDIAEDAGWRPVARRLVIDHDASLDAALVALRAWGRPLIEPFDAWLTEVRTAEGPALGCLPVDGHRVMELLEASGAVVGEALSWLRERQIELGPLSPERASELLREWDRQRDG